MVISTAEHEMWRAGWWGAWWGHVHERVASGHRGPGHDDTHVLGRHRPQVHALGVAMRAGPKRGTAPAVLHRFNPALEGSSPARRQP